MATRTLEEWQEIANRNLQGKLEPDQRVRFDEIVKRGLVTIPERPPDAVDQIPQDWAVSEMSPTQRALAGGGKFFSDLYSGAKDLALDTFGSDEAQQRNNEQIALSQERDAPLMSDPYGLGGNIATGVTTMLPTMAIPGANTLTGAALTGGAYGMLQPTADDQSRTLNTMIGGAGGAGGYGLGKGLGLLGQQVAKPVQVAADLFKNPRDRAIQKLGQAVERDMLQPEKLAANMRKMGPQSTIADAGGENVLGLADAAVQVPGQTRNQAIGLLNRRQLSQSGRTMDALSDSVGDEKNFYSVLDEISESLRKTSSPLYKEAFDANQDVASKTIDKILETPAGRKAFQGASVRMQNRMAMMGKADDELTDQMRFLADIDRMDRVPEGVSKGLKLRTMDFIKQEMDDMISSLEKQVRTGNARPGELSDLRQLKNKMVNELDRLDITGGKYAQARQVYAGDAQNRTALETGRKFLKDDAEVTEKLLAKMSDSEKEHFRAGAMRAIRDKIESAPDTADVYKRIFNTESSRKKLRALFPDSRSYTNFARRMQTEANFFKTRGAITGNSATARRMAQEVDIGLDPNATSGAVLSWRYALARGLMRKLKGEGGITEPVRDELGGILFNQSPTAKDMVISELLKNSVGAPPLPGLDQALGGILSKPGTVAPFPMSQ